MFNKLWKLIEVLFQPKIFKQLMSMNKNGYLYDIGWINSFKHHLPVDINNNPLPWVTYSFMQFILNRLNNTMEVFEFGSGNSTLWYADKVKSVISVEHDYEWFSKIKESMPINVNIIYKELLYGGKYSNVVNSLDNKFDIIIVDGRDRINCMKNSIDAIKDDGIIVLDDSDRESYQEGINYLLDNDFKQIDFWGIAPGVFFNKCTTIFYKNKNCIGI